MKAHTPIHYINQKYSETHCELSMHFIKYVYAYMYAFHMHYALSHPTASACMGYCSRQHEDSSCLSAGQTQCVCDWVYTGNTRGCLVEFGGRVLCDNKLVSINPMQIGIPLNYIIFTNILHPLTYIRTIRKMENVGCLN